MDTTSKPIIIVEPHSIAEYGLSILLADAGYKITERFKKQYDFFEAVSEKMDGSIVIIEINPGYSSRAFEIVERVKLLKENRPKIKIIVLSSEDTMYILSKAITANIDGYVLKRQDREEILLALEAVHKGRKYFGSDLTEILVELIEMGTAPIPDEQTLRDNNSVIASLSKREKEVLMLIGEGFKNEEIAERLFIAPRTVSAHKQRIIEKLNLSNYAALARLAYHLQS